MSISERERQALTTIERDLAATGPELTSMLAMFTRLADGEDMPVRKRNRRAPGPSPERARRVVAAPSAGTRPSRARPAGGRRAPRQIRSRLSWYSPWLLWFAFVIVLITVTLVVKSTAGRGPCSRASVAACRQAPPPSSSGAVAGK